jgi:hypothetical protein
MAAEEAVALRKDWLRLRRLAAQRPKTAVFRPIDLSQEIIYNAMRSAEWFGAHRNNFTVIAL